MTLQAKTVQITTVQHESVEACVYPNCFEMAGIDYRGSPVIVERDLRHRLNDLRQVVLPEPQQRGWKLSNPATETMPDKDVLLASWALPTIDFVISLNSGVIDWGPTQTAS